MQKTSKIIVQKSMQKNDAEKGRGGVSPFKICVFGPIKTYNNSKKMFYLKFSDIRSCSPFSTTLTTVT